ncbi:MAG: NTP transferase domain-containing protein [Chloroflexi bacterium]|nr:NTP transferase domain-containing protein [Chloroflexota bacterium]
MSAFLCVDSRTRGTSFFPVPLLRTPRRNERLDRCAPGRRNVPPDGLNPDPDRGMFNSIQIGVAAAMHDTDFLVALADQPMITGSTIRSLLDLFAAEQPAALQPAFGGKRGHPVLFSRRLREPLLAMPESATLRDLLHSIDVTKVELATDAVLRDIDLPEDYAREIGRQSAGAAGAGEAVTADYGAHYGREKI